MEDLKTCDPLFPPNFVTIHHLRERWLERRQQQQQKLKQLETRPRSPPVKPPPRPTPPFPPPEQKDQRKRPEQELPRRETDIELERGKAASPRDESDSRPSPANRWAGRRNASVKEGSDGRQAIDSDGPKPFEKSSRGEYAGFGVDGKAESALVKDQRKQPEQELPRGEIYNERQRVKASPRNESDSRASPANRWGVRRSTSVKEGSDGRQAIDSNGPKPSETSSCGEYAGFGADEEAESALVKEGSDGRQAIDSDGPKPFEKSSRGEYAGFGGDGKAESALVKDQRKQPEQELPRGEIYNERQRVKASPRNESYSQASPANRWGVRRNTSVKEGSDGRQAIDSNGPKPSETSSCGEYAGFGADEEAESALVKEGSDGRQAIDSDGPKPFEKSSRGEYAGFGGDGKAESALVKDQRKQPEQELPRGEIYNERQRVKASPRNESYSQASPANRWGVRRNTSVKEGSDGRQAIDSNGPKPSETSSCGEYAGFGADEEAESALVKDQRKQPEKELMRGEINTKRERVKASPRNESDSRASPANRWGVRRNTSVKEGSDGRQAIDSNDLKPSETSSRGEYAGFSADEEAESALVKDERKQPEKELMRGEINAKRERVKASPRNESDSRRSPANHWPVQRNTSVKKGIDGGQLIGSNGPKPSKKSSRGEYEGFGADKKAESALVATVSVVAESAEEMKKTEESEKKKKKASRKKNNKCKGKGRLDEDIFRAKETGVKLEEGEVNEPAEKVKKEKFQRASSEGQNVVPESKEVRVEVKTEEGVVHPSAKEVKKLFRRAGSESENAMLESKEGRVEVENVASNASQVMAEAEGLNKQVLAINSKVEIKGELKKLPLQYVSTRGGFQLRRTYRGHREVYGAIKSKKQQWGERKQNSDMVWVRKEDTTDGSASKSRVKLVL